MTIPFVEFTVYPDECDAYGHLNQAAFLSLFERARWEMLARTAGMGMFTAAEVWPAVRRTTIEYHAQVYPADRLRFEQRVSAIGRTSFTMEQSAWNTVTDRIVATAELVFVCVNRSGQPVAVPESFRQLAASAADSRRMTINGVSLSVESRGEGPAIVFVHGYPLGGFIWRHQVDHLPGWRCINPDLRGLGQSSTAHGAGRLEQYTDDLVGLLDELGVAQGVICGLSLGGYIAFDLVRRYRNRISALILASTQAQPDTPEGRAGRDRAIKVAQTTGASSIAEMMVPKLFAPDAESRIPEVMAVVRGRINHMRPDGIVQALEALRDRPDSQPLLSTLAEIPTLVLAGATDRAIKESTMQGLATSIPGSVYQVIEGAGHLTPMEQPEATTEAILGFLSRISP